MIPGDIEVVQGEHMTPQERQLMIKGLADRHRYHLALEEIASYAVSDIQPEAIGGVMLLIIEIAKDALTNEGTEEL